MRFFVSICLWMLAFGGVAHAEGLTARISPERLHAEPVRAGQALNFDVIVQNDTQQALELSAIEVAYLDARGRALLVRNADGNGSSPAIAALGQRRVAPGEEHMFFNPFPISAQDFEIASVRARLTFAVEGSDAVVTVDSAALLAPLQTPTVALPLRGDLLVYAAHDLMAHHRRFDYAIPPLRAFGMVSNAGRYAYDFVPLDATGARVHGDEAVAQNWVGFGTPVLAPANGVVVEVRSDMPDNGEWDVEQLPSDPNVLFGNHVIIEHQPGIYLVLAHLQQGSVRVEVGERISEGQVLAAIGHSGSSLFPHLHFQVMDGRDSRSEGLPTLFANFDRIIGDDDVRVRRGQAETGDVIRRR